MEHGACADACWSLTESQAEQDGFVKIYLDSNAHNATLDGRVWYTDKSYITAAQAKTLREKGFKVDETQILAS